MDRRAVRGWFGKPGRSWWHVVRLILAIADGWDVWLGSLALSGVDPHGWNLNRMLAAYEVQLRQGAKDEAEWQRTVSLLTAEPPEVRRERRRSGAAAAAGRMTVDDAEALVARLAAADAAYG